MMDFEQYLLVKLAEECNEVAQRALKAAQFGMTEVQKGQDKTNAERTYDELNDLLGVVALLNAMDQGFDYIPDYYAVKAKKDKITKYHNLSSSLGKVQ